MQRKLIWGAILLIVASLGLVYGQSASFDFLDYDDAMHIYENKMLNPPSTAHIKHLWDVPFRPAWKSTDSLLMPPYEQLYAPLTFTVWAGLSQVAPFEYAVKTASGSLSNFNPAVFHAANVLTHILVTLTLFFLLLRLLKLAMRDPESPWLVGAALVGALVFGLHPYQAESVAWCTQLNTLLSTLFGLLSLLLYLKFAEGSARETQKAMRLWSLYGGALALFVLALLAKPSILLLPLLAFLLVDAALHPSRKKQLLWLAPWLFLAAIWVWIVSRAQPPLPPEALVPWWGRPFLMGDSLAFYLGHLFTPWLTAPDYGRDPQGLLRLPQTYIIWLVPVGLLIAAWRFRKQWPWLLAGYAVFIICILPTSGIVGTYFQYRSVVSDRYMYLPLLGVAIVVTALLSPFSSWPRKVQVPIAFLAVAIPLILGLICTQQVSYWSNDFTLYSAQGGMHANPHDWWSWSNLGASFARQDKYQEAIMCYERALDVDPTRAEVHFKFAATLNMVGQLKEASRQVLLALTEHPDDPPSLDLYGTLLARQGHLDKALVILNRAVELGPTSTTAHTNLGTVLEAQGHHKEAIKQWEIALSLNGNRTLLTDKLQSVRAKLAASAGQGR